MFARILMLAALLVAVSQVLPSVAQDDDTVPFHEVAQVLVNTAGAGNTTVSITLQSTSTDDITLPDELASRIGADDRIAYIAVTNEDSCVPGVLGESCILVSALRSGEWSGIDEVQAGAREIGDSYIDELNAAFDTRASFHSVYIHHSEGARLAQAADRRIVSAVYTMPQEHTASMHTKIGGIILSRDIRDGGGFYEASRRIVALEGSQMLISMTPVAGAPLMQVRVSAILEGADSREIDPLALLPVSSLERSSVFPYGSNPLGSLVRAIVVPDVPSRILPSSTTLLPTVFINGELLPSAVGHSGWVFDPSTGPFIDGRFLFGDNRLVEDEELAFSIVPIDEPLEPSQPTAPQPPTVATAPSGTDGTDPLILYVMGAIIAGAAGAALYLLRRR